MGNMAKGRGVGKTFRTGNPHVPMPPAQGTGEFPMLATLDRLRRLLAGLH